MGQLEEYLGLLSEVAYKRAHHVVTENARVLDGMEGLRMGSFDQFGGHITESYGSLRDRFEVRCAALDLMVELANQQSGVYGAGMTGGGFGGYDQSGRPMVAAWLSKAKWPCRVSRP